MMVRVKANRAKAKLKAGETLIGTYMRHRDAGISEILCYLGFDFILFDSEHGPIAEVDAENLARVCELTECTPIIRVNTNMASMIGRNLDTGMQGVQIPMVNSADEARAAVRAAKYQPIGARGLAAARAAHFGQLLPFTYKDHIEKSNEETMVIVQIETPQAIDNLPQIVEVPDIDVIFIGPTDLSNSLGHPGDFKHADVQRAFDRIISIVSKTDKKLGVLAATTEAVIDWKGRGARYIMTVFEAILGPAVRNFLATVRQA
jgi:4-hydroxy-2-oxoheptanedioate aldolase